MRRLREAGGLALEPKQAWTPVAEFAGPGPRRGQLRPRRDALRAPARRARRDRRARALLRGAARVRERLAFAPCTVSPVLAAQGTYPFVRIERAKREAADGRASRSSTSARATRASRPTRRSARRSSTGSRSGWATRRRRACPSCATAIAGWFGRRFGVELDPDSEVIPTYGSKEAIFSFAQLVVDPRRPRDTVVVTEPGYPVPARGAAFAGRAGRVAAAARGERLPARPRRGRGLGPDRPLLGQLPEQPDRCARARSRSSSGSPSSRASTTSCSAPTRPTASSGSPSRPCSALQVADRTNVVVFQTLSKRSSMTGYRSGFVAALAGADLGALKTYRPVDGRRAAGVRPARVGRRVERRGARRAHARRVPAEARGVPAGARAEGLARRGERGDDVPLGRGAGRRDVGGVRRSGCSSTGSSSRPGSYLGAAGEGYVRIALVPTLAECERAAAILEEVL